MTFTKEQIEQWLRELAKEAESRQYDLRYRFGFVMGLTAVMRKMDDALRG